MVDIAPVCVLEHAILDVLDVVGLVGIIKAKKMILVGNLLKTLLLLHKEVRDM